MGKGPKMSTGRMIFALWKPYKRLVVITFLLLLGFAFMESISIALLYTVFSQTTQTIAKSGAPDKVYSYVTFVAKYVSIKDVFVLSCALLIISHLIKSTFAFLNQFASFYLSSRTKRDFHDKIFGKFLNSEYSFFLNYKHGWLIHRTMTVPLEASILLDYVPRMMVNALKIVAIITMLFFISPPVTGFIIILGAVYYFITKVVAKKVSYHIGKEKIDELEGQNEMAAEAFTGIKQIKVFSVVKTWVDRFWKSVLKYSQLEIRDSIWLLAPPCIMEFAVIGALAFVLIILKSYHESSFVTILPVVAIFGYGIQRIIPAFNLLGAQRISFSGKLPVLEIVYKILSESTSVKDGDIELEGFDDRISFKDVSFSYPDREVLFKDLTFNVEKGKSVAIVGPSGSGKSTIVDLMLRLFSASGGEISIDGKKLNDIQIDSWLSKVGLVSQDTFVFHGSIKENIGFGMDDVSSEAIIKAAEIANAHEFILEFPEGYDTVVGDRGMKLSVGQRQRIAIARAILRDPEILILDEATSSLDNISEALVQEAINNIAKNHTVIMIAHRLSTIIGADRIIVLDNGRIKEEGTHKELMDKQGLYWRLYNTQKSSSHDDAEEKMLENLSGEEDIKKWV
ncbi:MAG: ABC transporter ATP-binding protein [Candidatus Omnitrophica bacterium]|nr:ABC transporter ATP-binding protein [Candidatus Omnitrophota bacterium]